MVLGNLVDLCSPVLQTLDRLVRAEHVAETPTPHLRLGRTMESLRVHLEVALGLR
jgi:hypothetical protein